jgi:hypothetical protein
MDLFCFSIYQERVRSLLSLVTRPPAKQFNQGGKFTGDIETVLAHG